MPWWVEIITHNPSCTYYFGPFKTSAEANALYGGFIEDLETEGNQVVDAIVKRCQPKEITLDGDEGILG